MRTHRPLKNKTKIKSESPKLSYQMDLDLTRPQPGPNIIPPASCNLYSYHKFLILQIVIHVYYIFFITYMYYNPIFMYNLSFCYLYIYFFIGSPGGQNSQIEVSSTEATIR